MGRREARADEAGVGVGYLDQRGEQNPWVASLPKPGPNKRLQATANSLRSYLAVRRESGVEECGNTSGIQVLDEPLELSVIDHSMT